MYIDASYTHTYIHTYTHKHANYTTDDAADDDADDDADIFVYSVPAISTPYQGDALSPPHPRVLSPLF